jgi:hypothetical protein
MKDEEAIYCPFCGETLGSKRSSSNFSLVAGILTIIASSMSLLVGTLQLIAYAVTVSPVFNYYDLDVYALLYAGALNLLCFALGILGGLLLARRKHFTFSLVSLSLVCATGVSTVTAAGLTSYTLFAWLLFGAPIVILSILGITFAIRSRSEYVSEKKN